MTKSVFGMGFSRYSSIETDMKNLQQALKNQFASDRSTDSQRDNIFAHEFELLNYDIHRVTWAITFYWIITINKEFRRRTNLIL